MSDYEVRQVKLEDIYLDAEFNCRGDIRPLDVIDLVHDIERNGLQFPITVQEIDDPVYNYRIIAGHRRFTAFKVLKRETIPAMVREGLDEVQARLLNLTENLKRKELNILQEAKAVQKLNTLGLTQHAIANELGMSRSWVQVRINLLGLPQAIQEEAAAGHLNQLQIKELSSLGDSEKQYEAVKRIKNARLNGEKGISVAKKPEENPDSKKRQAKNIVKEMIIHIGKTLGYGLTTRALAWANGEISSSDLYMEIKKAAEEQGIKYVIPVKEFEDAVS